MTGPHVVDLFGSPLSDRPPMEGAEASASDRPPTAARRGRRLRLASVTAKRDDSSRRHVEVVLERRGREWTGSAEGVGGPQVELRLAAEAALEAVNGSVGAMVPFRMVGVKSIRAFDGDLVLVGLRGQDQPGRRLVGAVPVTGSPARAAAAAVLDALNRHLELEPEA